MEGKPALAGVLEPGLAGLADRWAATVVLIVRCHISDPGMQPDSVVLRPHDGQLGSQHGRVADGEQVWPLGLDVTEQGLDPGLVGRLSG